MRSISVPVFTLSLLALSVAASAEEAASPLDAIASGHATLNLRPRYEYADQTGKDTGEAATLRTLAGWKSNAWNGLSGTIDHRRRQAQR
jgi:hypothetical protein